MGKLGGVLWGSEINYQLRKNLLTLRYSQLNDVDIDFVFLFPVPISNTYTDEIALLYGRRKIKNGHSLSFSVGPSYNFYSANSLNSSDGQKLNAFGAAFETNIKWFKNQKRNPFGFSFGLKLSGNIAKTHYVGLSLILGIGWHKIYNKKEI